MRARIAAVVGALLAALCVMVGAAPAMAADGPTAIKGLIIGPDKQPVAGVKITVTNAEDLTVNGKTTVEGAFTKTVSTNKVGVWEVPLPTGGEYTVSLDQQTLPPGVSLRNTSQSSRTVDVFTGRTSSVLFPTSSGTGPDEGDQPSSNQALQLTVDGLLFGLIIALAAIGLSLVYGTTGLTNFSHGELITLGVVLGGSIVGRHAAELISVIALAVTAGLRVNDIVESLLVHPALAEALADAAE